MLNIDLRAFERKAQAMGQRIDQVPYALSLALNGAALQTRTQIVGDTWPRSINVRNKSFLKAALSTKFADKRNLKVSVFDQLGRASINLHATGGTKVGRGKLAIPSRNVPKTAKGVPTRLRPRNLKRKVVKGNLVFQAQGKGKNSSLRLMYKLTASARIKQDVPFHGDFRRFFTDAMERRFPEAMARAMRTAR